MKERTINSNAIKVDWVVNKAALDLVIKAGLQLSILACFNRSAVHSGTVYLVCKFFRNAHHNLCVMGRGNSCLTSLNLHKPK